MANDTQQNNLLLLSDSLHKIRDLANDTKINTLLQDKKYMELARAMAEITRHANTCAGVFFGLYMANQPTEDIPLAKISETPNSN